MNSLQMKTINRIAHFNAVFFPIISDSFKTSIPELWIHKFRNGSRKKFKKVIYPVFSIFLVYKKMLLGFFLIFSFQELSFLSPVLNPLRSSPRLGDQNFRDFEARMSRSKINSFPRAANWNNDHPIRSLS